MWSIWSDFKTTSIRGTILCLELGVNFGYLCDFNSRFFRHRFFIKNNLKKFFGMHQRVHRSFVSKFCYKNDAKNFKESAIYFFRYCDTRKNLNFCLKHGWKQAIQIPSSFLCFLKPDNWKMRKARVWVFFRQDELRNPNPWLNDKCTFTRWRFLSDWSVSLPRLSSFTFPGKPWKMHYFRDCNYQGRFQRS